MVHRAILGSYERFLVLLIEHFAGAFPTWLSPVQTIILPISEKFKDYASSVEKQLLEADVRTEIDASDESLGKRIRAAKMQKVPYILVVGGKEIASNTVAVNARDSKDQTVMPVGEFLEKIIAEIKEKK